MFDSRTENLAAAELSSELGSPPISNSTRSTQHLSRTVSLITIVAIGAVWWLLTAHELVTPLFLPSPAEVWRQLQAVGTNGYADASLWAHVGASLARIGAAAVIAFGLGAPIGIFMGLSPWVKGLFDPPIEFYWPLPPLAYLPLMIIWLGIGETSKVTLLALAMFAPICLAAQAGVRGVSREHVNAALSLGANRWQLFRHLILPSALPEILTGTRIAIGVGWGTLVAAELIAATRGIGFMIMSASHFLATDVVFVGIGIIAVLAFAFSYGLRSLETILVPWKGKQ
jgi:taurine transport system permease protein